MKTIIIQVSPKGTASTVLVNILYGLIPETSQKEVKYYDSLSDFHSIKFNTNENIQIIKTHFQDIDKLIAICNKNNTNNTYNIYFICSERPQINRYIDAKYKLYSNVIVFSYDEINETPINNVYIIVENIYKRINSIFKLLIPLNIEGGVNRLNAMNKKYEEIKDKLFNETDPFYLIHGSHKNRKY